MGVPVGGDVDPGGLRRLTFLLVGEVDGGRFGVGERRLQEASRPELSGPEAGPLPARDVPDLGHRVLGDLGQAAGPPGESHQPDHEADPAAAQPVDIVLYLVTDEQQPLHTLHASTSPQNEARTGWLLS